MSVLLSKDTRHTAIDKYQVRFGTGSSFVKKGRSDDFLNSAIYRDESTVIVLQDNKQDDELIQLREAFNSEINKFQEIPEHLATETFNSSMFYLSQVKPEKISIEVTNNDSLYFSLIKDDYKIYLEEYIDDGEVIVTMFKNGVKQKSMSGKIAYIASRLQEVTSY